MNNTVSVTQLNTYIKNLFVRDGILSRISVKGEVSNCKYHNSGHIYFSLKDERSQLSCVMFSSDRLNGLNFTLEDGQNVTVTGSVSVYERGGVYSLHARTIELSGQGELYVKFEALKKRLYSEGYFAASHKKAIPRYVKKLGIVTAETGAAVRDIINVSRRRNPGIQLVLAPAKVQGAGAAESVVRALKKLDAYGVDCIIVGRGGGSIEDLWAFNEEITAMAVYDLKTPVISAVGHETDTTIIDYVSDLRAPTPSAAAELAVFSLSDLQSELVDARYDLYKTMNTLINAARQKMEVLGKDIEYLGPVNRLEQKKIELDRTANRIGEAMRLKILTARNAADLMPDRLSNLIWTAFNRTRHRSAVFTEQLKRLSPIEKISKGYAYVSHENKGVTSIAQVNYGDCIEVSVVDGALVCEVEEIIPKNIPGEE